MAIPNVLIADDDVFSRALVVNKIIGELNARPFEAKDGLEAMNLLREQRIDLLIVDLEMPSLDGYELISCVRGHPRYKHLPIVVVSGKQSKDAIDRALLAGATSFLGKPLNWTAFGGHIRHLLVLSQLASNSCPGCAQKIA